MNHFINVLSENLGVSDKDKVYRILKSVLHTLRDNISIDESLQLIAQLPFMMKAVYVENWSVNFRKNKIKHIKDFILNVKERENQIFYYDFLDLIEVEQSCRIVFQTLCNSISEGEVNDIKAILPQELKSLINNEITF